MSTTAERLAELQHRLDDCRELVERLEREHKHAQSEYTRTLMQLEQAERSHHRLTQERDELERTA